MTEINAGLVYLADFALSLLFGILMWRRARRRTDLYMARWERLNIGETAYLYEAVVYEEKIMGDNIVGNTVRHSMGKYDDEKRARGVVRWYNNGKGATPMRAGIRKVAVHRPPKAEDAE